MSKGPTTELPRSLKGYKLKKVHHGFFGRIILWIIILLIILWFINRQVVFDLWDWLRNFIANFL